MAGLDQLVFGAWDPIPDNAYDAAIKSGVLDRYEQVEPISDFLKSIEPMPAVFDNDYVKRIDGTNTKDTSSKLASVEAVREDIRRFKEDKGCDRWSWSGADPPKNSLLRQKSTGTSKISLEGLHDDDEAIAPSMIYAYAALMEGVPFVNGAPNLTADIPALERLARDKGVPICGKDFKTARP